MEAKRRKRFEYEQRIHTGEGFEGIILTKEQRRAVYVEHTMVLRHRVIWSNGASASFPFLHESSCRWKPEHRPAPYRSTLSG